MRLFPVPMDLTGEEKTIGGVISIRQAVYMMGAVVCTALLYLFLKIIGLPFGIRLCIAIFAAPSGIYLAFGRIKDIPMDKYIYLWFMYHKRDKKLYLRGDD